MCVYVRRWACVGVGVRGCKGCVGAVCRCGGCGGGCVG